MSDYRIAMLAYPPAYRREHGSELIGLANELSDGRWSVKQFLGLVGAGLRTRARVATQGSARQAWAGAVRTGLLLWLALTAGSGFAYSTGVVSSRSSDMLLALSGLQFLAIASMAFGTSWRWAALVTATRGAILWVAWSHSDVMLIDGVYGVATVVSSVLVVGMAWWLAVATDGRRAGSPAAVGLLMMVVIVVETPPFSQVFVPLYIILFYVLVFAAVVVWRHDPRPAAAAATYLLLLAPLFVPAFFRNDAAGWDYWGPITVSGVIVLSVAAASVSGIKRLATD